MQVGPRSLNSYIYLLFIVLYHCEICNMETDSPRSTNGMTDDEILNEIRASHTKSISFASKATAEEESRNINDAMASYLLAMRHSENGVRFDIHSQRYSGPQWEIARDLQQGMMNTLENVRERIYHLQTFNHETDSSIRRENPPPYSPSDPLAMSNPHPMGGVQGEPLLVIDRGVQMYFVTQNNEVGAPHPSYPTTLKIVLLEGANENPGGPMPQAILQVGDWMYPLKKDHMPVLHSAHGAYIFPNCSAMGIEVGSSIGIVLSKEVSRENVETFESILQNYAVFESEGRDNGFVDLTEFVETSNSGRQSTNSDLSDRIARSLANGAEALRKGVKKSGEYATEIVENESRKIHSKITPNSTPTTISDSMQKGLHYTYEVSKVSVQITRWIVKWMCTITSKVGQQIAPYLKPKETDNTNQGDDKKECNENMSGFLKVANASMIGIGKIWKELEKAGSTIAKAVTTATVSNVEFKYGSNAGQAANMAMGAAVNFGSSAIIFDNLGVKTISELTAEDDEEKEENANGTQPEGTKENHDENQNVVKQK